MHCFLELALWETRAGSIFARNQMQDACVARVDTLACSMLGDVSTVGVHGVSTPNGCKVVLESETLVSVLPHGVFVVFVFCSERDDHGVSRPCVERPLSSS